MNGGRPSCHELEERLKLAGAKNLRNCRIDLAKHDAASFRPHQTLEGHEIAQRRRSGKTHAAQVDHQVRTSLGFEMGLVVVSEILHRRGVQPQAVPELRDQDAVHDVCFESKASASITCARSLG